MLEKEVLREVRGDRAVSAAEAQLADRLDRLSAPLAEKVLHRAIELHQDAQFSEDSSVSFAELSELANELGIDTDIVRRALLAELDTEHIETESLFDRLFGPKRVSGGIVAEADAELVADKIDEWMGSVEGMVAVRHEGSTTLWESAREDGRMVSTLKNMGAEAAANLRQTELSSGDQLIEIEVNSTAVRKGALLVLATGIFIGLCAAFGVALNETFANFAVRFLVPLGIGTAVGLGGALATAKHYAASIKKQINRALDGIVHLTTFRGRKANKGHEHGSGHEPGGARAWGDIVDEIYE